MDLSRLDLNLLVVLDAVLREKHITRAGQQLHLSQSATSMALSRLRRVFQDPLLVRHGHTMVLTPLAVSLVEPVRDVLAAIERITSQEPEFTPAQSQRTFTVVASEYISAVLLRPLMGRLAVTAPRVQLEVVPGDIQFRERLRRDEVDLFIVPQHRSTTRGLESFKSVRISEDPWVVVLDRAHHDLEQPLTPARFAELPYVTYEPPGRTPVLELELDARDVQRTVVMRCTSILLPGFMIKDTPMIAVLPSRLADIAVAAGGLVQAPLPVDLPPLVEAAYWHPRRSQDQGHAWLRQELISVAESVSGPPDGHAMGQNG